MKDGAADIDAALDLAPARTPRWLRLGLGAALLSGAVGAGLWLAVGGGPAPDPFVTEVASRGPLTVTVTATGTVEPTNLVEISSELSGMVREVLVDHNDVVEIGQRLARLDTAKLDAQLAHARAALTAQLARVAEAEATLREATDQHERVRALADRAVSTIQARDAAIATLRRAEAAVAVTRADADVARADLLLNQTNLAKACICSPIRGVVLDRNVEPGQIVASSLQAPVLFTIAEDLSQMELRVDVDEADMGSVRVGQTARFTVEAYRGRSFPATISALRYAPKTIDGVVTYEALLSIDNAELLLRPGMTATAEIVVAQVDEALLVPNAALRFAPPPAAEDAKSGGGLLGLLIPRRPGAAAPTAAPPADPDGWRTLWVARGGEAAPVRVRVGASDGLRTEILEGPLAPGDLAITDVARP